MINAAATAESSFGLHDDDLAAVGHEAGSHLGEATQAGHEQVQPPAFLRSPRLTAVPPAAEPEATLRVGFDPEKTLIIPAGVRIKGDVVADALYLCGEIEGNITIGDGPAIIAATGKVNGRLEAGATVTVAGKISGEGVCLRSVGEIDIGAQAEIQGDIEYTSIMVRGGAQIEGRLTKARA